MNSVHADDWTTKWVIIATDVNNVRANDWTVEWVIIAGNIVLFDYLSFMIFENRLFKKTTNIHVAMYKYQAEKVSPGGWLGREWVWRWCFRFTITAECRKFKTNSITTVRVQGFPSVLSVPTSAEYPYHSTFIHRMIKYHWQVPTTFQNFGTNKVKATTKVTLYQLPIICKNALCLRASADLVMKLILTHSDR